MRFGTAWIRGRKIDGDCMEDLPDSHGIHCHGRCDINLLVAPQVAYRRRQKDKQKQAPDVDATKERVRNKKPNWKKTIEGFR